jgi:uncharacterized repeat protein (TIGR01451 family)
MLYRTLLSIVLCNFLIISQAQHAKNWPADTIEVKINSGDPAFPFPQFTGYEHGLSLAENNAEGVTHADMEKTIREAYAIMMHRATYSNETVNGINYIVYNYENVPANGGLFLSEGDGYALLAAAYMADKTTFDGLWMWTHDNRTSNTTRYIDCQPLRNDYNYGSGTVGWKNDENTVSGSTDNDSNIEGDIDIAMALLMASKQWPSGGISDGCGGFHSYKDIALDFLLTLSDTTYYSPLGPPSTRNDPSGENGYFTGIIGFDGYQKNGNTGWEATSWADAGYNWDGTTLFNHQTVRNSNALYVGNLAPAYYKEFYEFLLAEDSSRYAWPIHQFKRAEASSDWLIKQAYNAGNIASAGSAIIDGTNVTFTRHPGDAFGQDFKFSWRTALNHLWHGNPNSTWDPATHETTLATPNSFEYEMAIRHAQSLKDPGSAVGNSECSLLGPSPEPFGPKYSGVSQIPHSWNPDGSLAGSFNSNFTVGTGSISAVISEDHELISDLFRQSELLWDDADYNSQGYSDHERYRGSTPAYFHGWFRLLGLLTTSGNLQAPLVMEPKANVRVYLSVDRTVAYPGEEVTYTVSYRNYGSQDAENVQINVPLGSNYSFIGATGNASLQGGAVVLNNLTIPGFTSSGGVANSSDNFSFTVKVGEVTNHSFECLQATISASNAPTQTSNEYPNNASHTMERNCVDLIPNTTLILEQSVNKEVINPGDEIIITQTIQNIGSSQNVLNGGRSNVNFSYAHYPNNLILYQHYRIWHDAAEAYVNLNNYRITYFLNSNVHIGAFEGSNPLGWNWTIDNDSDLDKFKLNPSEGPISLQMAAFPSGTDARGNWNQTFTIQFANTLSAPTSHILNNWDNEYLIHKGNTGLVAVRTALSTGNYSPFSPIIEDDWSYSEDVESTTLDGQMERFWPITDNWAYGSTEGVAVTNYNRNVCDPDVENFDALLVEEFDGYTWRRIAGNAPLYGSTETNVTLIDTISSNFQWVGFEDSVINGISAVFSPAAAQESFTGIVHIIVPSFMVGDLGAISYRLQGTGTCPETESIVEHTSYVYSDSKPIQKSSLDIEISCSADLGPFFPEQNSLYLTSEQSEAETNDVVDYTILFVNNETTSVINDLTDPTHWAPIGSTDLPDFHGYVGFSSIDNAESGSPNGYTLAHAKSHGKNGSVVTEWELPYGEYGNIILRHTNGTPGQDDFKGIRVEFKQGFFGQGYLSLAVYEDTSQIFVNENFAIAETSSRVPIKVELQDDQLLFFAGDFESPVQTINGLTVLSPGQAGIFAKISYSLKLYSYESHLDSGFDIELVDVIPENMSLSYASHTYNLHNDTLKWALIPGPVLQGDTIERTISLKIDQCVDGDFLYNIAHANLFGHAKNQLGTSKSLECNMILANQDSNAPSSFAIINNPVTNELKVVHSSSSGIKNFQITNGFTTLEFSSLNEKESLINIEELPAGLYFLREENQPGKSLKFLKQ